MHVDWKVIVAATAILLFFVAERLLPAVNQQDRFIRLARNYGIAAINFGVSPLIVVPMAAFASQMSLQWRPDWYSGWTGLTLDLLLLDVWIYWWHRLNHMVPFLWRFHEVHHLDEQLDSTSAVRFHFGEVILSSIVRAAVILIAAIPLTSVIVFELVVLVSALFHHSNLRLPSKLETILSRVIVTPSIHWIHHHAKRDDTDSSYATVLSLWDGIFASSSKTVRTPEMSIGVEGRRDVRYLKLLLRPFKNNSPQG
jgi:sterol desaturase/sphingolipid hydroxylase (fatty acid hydroxylase superfamily)